MIDGKNYKHNKILINGIEMPKSDVELMQKLYDFCHVVTITPSSRLRDKLKIKLNEFLHENKLDLDDI